MPSLSTTSESALAQTHYRVRISDAGSLEQRISNILWTTFSGIEEQSSVIKYPDPNQQRLRKTTGLRDMGDSSISTPYIHLYHKDLLSAWQNYTCQDITLEIQPVLCGTTGVGRSETPYGDPFIIDGCKWSQIKLAEVNRESNSISMLMCTFSMYQWRRGNTEGGVIKVPNDIPVIAA